MDTKQRIAEAALSTLRSRGFAGASAREIAAAGDLNQALVFYHHGSVENALLAALDLVSERRMAAYGEEFARTKSLADLAALAKRIYDEDVENGYVTVLCEMVAGGLANAELGAAVASRLEPWTAIVEDKVREVVAGSILEPLIAPGDVAFVVIALYLGVDMLSQLGGDHARAKALLDVGSRYAPLAAALLPSQQSKETP